MIRRPPDVLITTPESLYLMLTSSARETLRSVRTVIVDEIHAMAASKRGSHLALSLERLEELCDEPPQRIGLSATQRPLEEIARFLGGSVDGVERPVTIVDAGHRKPMELQVVVPVEDMGGGIAARRPGACAPERRRPATATAPGTRDRQPNRSIWPSIHPALLELIRTHRSTIVFTNARRLAERLAASLNELAGEDLVRAHHGSLAREQRLEVEDALKEGRLRAIVATSSLELGIDMGAVDLVIQVESPGSVASGLQRIGRAGHQVGEPSRGRIFPKFRGDLLEAAVVAERMLAGEIEHTRYLRNPLDVLAQQIVAMCAVDERGVDELYDAVRRAAPFAELSKDVFLAVLDMLAGRYPSDGFAELRPRVVWDRGAGTVRAREGAGRIAITSGGTIPDRGLYSVFLADGPRVGELDEEMVYESRRGDVIVLGASAWRIEDITRDRVIVSPAPGEQGRMPFWHGDKPGRPIELGRAVGAFTRTLRGSRRDAALERLRRDVGLDELAAGNLVSYLEEQMEATGAVPDDRTVVVERFRDEVGDWRMCVLSPFGSRVHAPWAMAIEARMLERFGPGAQVLWSDDGIVVRLPESVDRIPEEELLFDPDAIEQAVVAAVPQTAMFASVFREAAARALLLPRRRPGQRTPLWQQRQRSADLLAEASKFPDFPILLEATRECLRDVFDVPALREVMADLRSRRTRLVAVDTEHASPFAQSLLFRWVGVYMYEGDAPLAERRAAALTLDRDLLRELLGSEELRELLDPRALDEVELELQRLGDGRGARSADHLHDLLRTLGDLTEDEIAARVEDADPRALQEQLLADGRAIRIRIAGDERLAAIEDAARLRDALGVSLPIGLPGAFTEETERPLEGLVRRYARTHGPFVASEVGARLGASVERVQEALTSLEANDAVVLGEFRPGGSGREWCDPDVLRRLRRRSLALLQTRGRAGRRGRARPIPPRVAGCGPAARRPRRARRRDRAPPGHLGSRVDPRGRRASVPGPRVPARRPRRPRGRRRRGLGRGGTSGWRRRKGDARLPLGGAGDAPRTVHRPPCGRVARRHPLPPRRSRCIVLDGARRRGRHRRRALPPGRALGPRLVRRGHERHAGAAAGVRPWGLREDPDQGARSSAEAGGAASRGSPGRRRPVVARRGTPAAGAGLHRARARPRPAAPGPARRRHPRGGPRRRGPGRLRRHLPGLQGHGGSRSRPPRLLRGRARRRPVRASRGGGPAALVPADGSGDPTGSRRRSAR